MKTSKWLWIRQELTMCFRRVLLNYNIHWNRYTGNKMTISEAVKHMKRVIKHIKTNRDLYK